MTIEEWKDYFYNSSYYTSQEKEVLMAVLDNMNKLTDLKVILMNGSATQVGKLPMANPVEFFSDWIAYNGNAVDYEIRFRFSKSEAERYKLD
jgi:hypothetical protein